VEDIQCDLRDFWHNVLESQRGLHQSRITRDDFSLLLCKIITAFASLALFPLQVLYLIPSLGDSKLHFGLPKMINSGG
jgi:hypothetical protein